MSLAETVIFERNDRLYLVAPVAPIEPSAEDLAEVAYASDLRKMAPSENLVWLRGRYVEADRPNLNGAEWSAKELTIASLTPMLMPVTVMHDPSTAVGMIADTRLVTPEKDGVPRARIDTTLGLWAHRFPQVVEEAMHNYRDGGLMQSMECLPRSYECGDCGQLFPNLGGAERSNWCTHLKGEDAAANTKPVRRLLNVTFTGTGLIFGSRGAKGAYSEAHLDLLQDEVAEFHERAHVQRKTPRRTPRMDTIEIPRSEYDGLKAKAEKLATIEPRVDELETAAAKVPELERDVERLEIEKKSAEDARDTEVAKREQLEEAARADTLKGERFGKLGTAFLGKLPASVKTRLESQAKTLKEEEWAERLEELEAMTGVKPDEAAAEEDDDVFTREEVARLTVVPPNAKEPSQAARSAVIGGLVKVLPKS